MKIGEADNPGHGRRGPKERNQRAIPKGTMKEHIWLRSHNVGSFRDKAKREDVLSADIDIYALQETNADIKTMHDAKTEFNKRQIRTIWSTPVEINKCGSGTTVAAAAPLYCTQLINNTLEAEKEELVGSSRIAASWIQTNGVERGIAVISFYGISGSNSDANKRRANERHLKAMLRYLAHHIKKKPSSSAWTQMSTPKKARCSKP